MVRVSLDGRMAVRMDLGHGIFDTDGGFGIGRTPVWSPKVDLTGVNAHARTGRALAAHGIFFDGDEGTGLDRVGGSVGKGDASGAIGGSLDLITLVQSCPEIRVDPLNGIDLLDLHFAVEVHEFGLRERNRRRIAVPIAYGFVQLLIGGRIQIRVNEIKRRENNRRNQDDINGHGFVGHRMPIHFRAIYLRVVRVVGCVWAQEYSRNNSDYLKI